MPVSRPTRLANVRPLMPARSAQDSIVPSDAPKTLRDIGGEIDLILLDGAFPLYLAVLKLVEPRLRTVQPCSPKTLSITNISTMFVIPQTGICRSRSCSMTRAETNLAL
jgi:hypothetical protein